MSRYTNQKLIDSILNGDDDVLFYLTKKYYQSARRWLRRNGCRDADTPSIFSNVIIKVYRDLRQSNISNNINFEQFFFNSLQEYFNQHKPNKNINDLLNSTEENEIIGACFSILDEASRKILSARYVDKLSFEQIAVQHNFSNPMIAQFEFNKAFTQFEKLTKIRLNFI